MLEQELTPDIQRWLETEPAQRDFKAGADLLLRITRNRILYANLLRNPQAKGELLEYHLQKILKKRLVDTTHEEVDAMMKQVSAIEKDHALVRPERSDFQKGKRADHDELPPEVQALYVENADLMRRMRDAHTKLRLISAENSTCPDSDRYPLAKAVIDYDRQYRDNWNRYDHYVKGTPLASTALAVDERTASKNALKSINLQLGKYLKNPTPSTAKLIEALYSQIANPSDALRQKMAQAGLLK